jgi:HSP20 family protein
MVWDIFEEIKEMERRIDRLMRETWRGEHRLALPSRETALIPTRGGLAVLQPFSDIEETDKEVKISAEMPGVDKKDIKISATEDRIEISAETEKEKKEEKKGRLLTERTYGKYYRRYDLPSHVNPNKIKSTFKNGVLNVTMTKTEVKKKVEIKVE